MVISNVSVPSVRVPLVHMMFIMTVFAALTNEYAIPSPFDKVVLGFTITVELRVAPVMAIVSVRLVPGLILVLFVTVTDVLMIF